MNLIQVGQPNFISRDGSFNNPATYKEQQGQSLQHQFELQLDSFDDDTRINIFCHDIDPSDESIFFSFAPDINNSPGIYSSTITIVPTNVNIFFWAKCILPSIIETQIKKDLRIAIIIGEGLIRMTQLFAEVPISQAIIPSNIRLTQLFAEIPISNDIILTNIRLTQLFAEVAIGS